MIAKDHIQEFTDIASRLGVLPITLELIKDPRFSYWSGCVNDKHHYGKGGLQQHTWEVVMLCLENRRFFLNLGHENIPEDVLFLSALYHDSGKMRDYQPLDDGAAWVGTEHKRIIHHISRSGIIWSKAVEKTNTCRNIEDEVLHAILSHHGQREFGSPVAPKSKVAWLVHICDAMSARIEDCDKFDIIHPR